MTTADYLIVGQGVAGSVLAWTLDQLGYRVWIAHDPTMPSASGVAAGIVNPLTGRKLVRTWRANELFPFLHQFYTSIERQLGTSFFHPLNIYRPYRSLAEKNSYESYVADPEVAHFVSKTVNSQVYEQYITNPYGGLEVTQSGWLDLTCFIKCIANYFLRKNQYIEGEIEYNKLIVRNYGVELRGVKARKIIFCEGVQGRENPLFNWLPYNPVKGQILTARVSNYPIKNIVNQGAFILPVDDTTIRIGATYTWHDLNWETTADGRAFLESKIRDLLRVPYEVVHQSAGIRPATKDRRPFIGLHPDYQSVGIFGGMGSKGVSLTPYLAYEFARFLEADEDLDPEVNIQRCLSLYYRK